MKRILVLAIAIALMIPAAAMAAGGSTCQSYNPQLCSVSSNTNAKQATTASTLPFTGLDVILLAAGGGALLSAGLVVRRISRNPS
jgi:hypothetical protein